MVYVIYEVHIQFVNGLCHVAIYISSIDTMTDLGKVPIISQMLNVDRIFGGGIVYMYSCAII